MSDAPDCSPDGPVDLSDDQQQPTEEVGVVGDTNWELSCSRCWSWASSTTRCATRARARSSAPSPCLANNKLSCVIA